MKTNKKGGGPADTIVSVWSMITWVIVIIVFILLFNLRACVSGHEVGEQTVEGELDEQIDQNDIFLGYLKAKLNYCDEAKNLGVGDLTHAELMNLFMKGKPDSITEKQIKNGKYIDEFENQEYAPYFETWYKCTEIYFGPDDTLHVLFAPYHGIRNAYSINIPKENVHITWELILNVGNFILYVEDYEAIQRTNEMDYEDIEPFSGMN